MVSTIERAKKVIRRRYRKLYLNMIWAHLIYRPVRRARWKVPSGMTTLDEFLMFDEKRGIPQKRPTDPARRGHGSHPLSLEMYVALTMDKELSSREVALISAEMVDELIEEGFLHVIPFMEWGEESEEVDEYVGFEARKRIGRDGERFREIDLRERMSRIEARFGLRER